MSLDELEQQTGKKAAVSLEAGCILQAAAARAGREGLEGETEERDGRSRVGNRGKLCGERSNEESRSTSSVVARMRDRRAYAS